MTITAGHPQGTGWQTSDGEWHTPGTLVFRHSDGGRCHSDWVTVTIADERVIEIDFSLD
ncbi:MAG: hypothetical protein ACI8UD_000576 [Planctomycetota bacterium]